MLIKQQALQLHLQKQLAPCYILIGEDTFLLNEAYHNIKTAFYKQQPYAEKKLSIHSKEDWLFLVDEANSYSLFSENVLIDALFEKKTLEAKDKKILLTYLQAFNSNCLIILRAPHLSSKQLQEFLPQQEAIIVSIYPLKPQDMHKWIIQQLKNNNLQFEPKVPDLIQQYTEGNMLACAQAIEKITLSAKKNTTLSTQEVLIGLSDQCSYSLFELSEACLLGDAGKAIHILRQALESSAEPTLILWLLSNEIRLLLQLSHLLNQGILFEDACKRLNVWTSRMSLYKKKLALFADADLKKLLSTCYSIDEKIKNHQSSTLWHILEAVTLSLCLKRLVGAL